MKKEDLMEYIKENSPFYRFADLNGHSLEQLQAIKEKVDAQIRNTETVIGIPLGSNSSLKAKK